MIKGVKPRLAEGGKIKCGGLGELRRSKSTGKEFRLPQKYEHWIVTRTTRDPETGNFAVDDEVMAALPHDEYGQVREIPIVVHSDDIEEVFPTAYAAYSGRALYCRGDGEESMLQSNGEVGPCPCDLLNGNGKIVCKPHGTLHCSIALPGRAVAGCVYKWRTTSIISIEQVLGSLQQILATVGTLRNLPLTLALRPMEVRPDGKATTVYVAHVELRAADILKVQREALEAIQRRQALGSGDTDKAYKLLVEKPGEEPDPEYVADEFHPEELVDPDNVVDAELENVDPESDHDYEVDVQEICAAFETASCAEELQAARKRRAELLSLEVVSPEQATRMRVSQRVGEERVKASDPEYLEEMGALVHGLSEARTADELEELRERANGLRPQMTAQHRKDIKTALDAAKERIGA